MIIVLDTNVIVSGFLNPYGAPGQILQQVTEGHLLLAYDARILGEYEKVLKRTEWDFNPPIIDDFIEQIQAEGRFTPSKPISHPLPDSSDAPFLEVALAAKVEALVTGNLKHFPAAACHGTLVLAPAAFLKRFQK